MVYVRVYIYMNEAAGTVQVYSCIGIIQLYMGNAHKVSLRGRSN